MKNYPVVIVLFFLLHGLKAQSVKPKAQSPSKLQAQSVKLKAINDTIQTESGPVKGYYNGKTHVRVFKGIPFAAPPVGEFRWKPPQPAIPWKGVKSCVAFGPSPMQPKPVSFFMIGPEFVVPQQPLSEDCLYLNVWTGAKNPQEKRPVLVWIYGGGFITGGAAAPGYSGEALAEMGIVFVSFNYRLGVFGFLSTPELSAESVHHSSGNYALMDQIAALGWVKKNIRAFGGDPDRVTIAGQSAGSASVNCLLASPLARGLFHRAIGESGSLVLENPFLKMRSLSDAEKEGEGVVKRLNVSDLQALRKLSAEELQKKAGGFYSPIVDGYVMPVSVAEAYKNKQQAHVAFLTGWNGDEGFVLGISKKEDFAKQAADFGADSNLFKRYFPSQTDSESISSQIRLSVDKTIGIPQYAWALKQNENTQAKTFLYLFTRKPPAEGEKKKFGAYHTAEIGYALHNLDSIRRSWQQVDRDLEKMMSTYWVQFVKTGDPSGAGLPAWGSFSNDNPVTMVFSDSPKVILLPNKEALDFLFSHYPRK